MSTAAEIWTIQPGLKDKDQRLKYQAVCESCAWAGKKYFGYGHAASAMEKHNHLERRKHAAVA